MSRAESTISWNRRTEIVPAAFAGLMDAISEAVPAAANTIGVLGQTSGRMRDTKLSALGPSVTMTLIGMSLYLAPKYALKVLPPT